MAIKVYLSPAAHGTDNPCSYDKTCSENTHANLYLDELIPYLDACGIAWKRNGKENVGSTGVQKAVRESNEWGADLHYVVHTNAANGKAQGSRPHVYPTGEGKAWAKKIIARRREIYPYPCIIKESRDLYEIVNTRAVCVYEELVFHDNVEDARWLHNHMRLMAEYTARAFCDVWGLTFVDPYAAISGDVNGDGKVNTTDARLALQHAAGRVKLTAEQQATADVDGNGKVNTTDARQILQKAVKKTK